MGLPRLGHLTTALVVLLASACSTSASGTQELWVEDNYVQCNEFDEPYRECLLVSHVEFGLYRHIEGDIEGFDYEEGTKYLLEVEEIEGPEEDGSYRLIKILSAED